MVKVVWLDFETRSACELKKCGAFVYSEHPTTQVICLAYALDDGAVHLWRPGDENPEDLFEAIRAGCWVAAHNQIFERSIWANIMVKVWGWLDVPENQWFDTMAAAARKAVPLDLEWACKSLGLEVQKDMEGNAALKQIMKPNAKTGEFNENPDLYAKVYRYCPIDVEAERSLIRTVGTLTKSELEIWRLNQRMNWRGLRFDMNFVADCQAVVDQALPPLAKAFEVLTGLKATQRDKVLGWIRERFSGFPDMKKETVEEALKDWPLPDDVRTVLELRGAISSTSISKLESMRNCVSSDGRARGLSQYHGATTGREAGRLLQPYNFPRGTVEYGKDEDGEDVTPWDTSVPAIQSRDAAMLGVMFSASEKNVSAAYQHLTAPISVVSSSLRHTMIAAPGRALCAGDFATIEARFVLAIAGQHDKLDVIKSGQDIYCNMASQIYNREVTKKNKEERQTGKNSVLGLGFQMGWRKFQQRYAKKQPAEFCERVVDIYRNEWAPEVPELWRALEEAALRTVVDRRPHEAYGIRYAIEDQWLTCRLHSGRKIYYLHPRECRKVMPWSTLEKPDIRQSWNFTAKKMGHMTKVDAYGGILTENVVQATARDLLCDRALVAEREGFPLVLTVYDEIVTEPEERRADPKVLQQIMEDIPAWALQLKIPVSAEVWAGERYRK